jgi:hypothetical protein
MYIENWGALVRYDPLADGGAWGLLIRFTSSQFSLRILVSHIDPNTSASHYINSISILIRNLSRMLQLLLFLVDIRR